MQKPAGVAKTPGGNAQGWKTPGGCAGAMLELLSDLGLTSENAGAWKVDCGDTLALENSLSLEFSASPLVDCAVALQGV